MTTPRLVALTAAAVLAGAGVTWAGWKSLAVTVPVGGVLGWLGGRADGIGRRR